MLAPRDTLPINLELTSFRGLEASALQGYPIGEPF